MLRRQRQSKGTLLLPGHRQVKRLVSERVFWKNEGLAFSGFHTYRLHFGVQSAITVSVFAPDRTFYSLEYAPPNPPASAGEMKLGPKGALMSVGAFAVFAPDLQTAVAIAGGLQCNYPRRRRGH